nr:metallophosphoesterase family protein [Angustibacter aerolatus]
MPVCRSLLLLADTHLPKRARDLPAEVWDAVDAADVVLHAGDWVDVDLLDRLEARARRLIGCWGNNDGAALRARLPEVAHATLGGLRFAVVHETGGRDRREPAGRARPPRRRRAGVRAQPRALGQHGSPRDAVAQPGFTDRPAPDAARHLPDADRGRRRAARRAAARAAAARDGIARLVSGA